MPDIIQVEIPKFRAKLVRAFLRSNSCLWSQTKQATRKDRTGEEETWQLFRFYPMIEVCYKNLFLFNFPLLLFGCLYYFVSDVCKTTMVKYLIDVFIILQELVENLCKGELSKNEYSCMNEPSPSTAKPAVPRGSTQSATSQTSQSAGGPKSMRSRRTANWARSSISDDGYGRSSIYIYFRSGYALLIRKKL